MTEFTVGQVFEKPEARIVIVDVIDNDVYAVIADLNKGAVERYDFGNTTKEHMSVFIETFTETK